MIDCNNNPTPSGGDAWWRRWYCAVVDGLRSALGTNYECIAIYRICLGIVLCIELGLRFQYLHVFYSDEG